MAAEILIRITLKMDLSNRLLESLQARCDARRLRLTLDAEAGPAKVPKLEAPAWGTINNACTNLTSSTLTKQLLPQAILSTGFQCANLLIAIRANLRHKTNPYTFVAYNEHSSFE